MCVSGNCEGVSSDCEVVSSDELTVVREQDDSVFTQ